MKNSPIRPSEGEVPAGLPHPNDQSSRRRAEWNRFCICPHPIRTAKTISDLASKIRGLAHDRWLSCRTEVRNVEGPKIIMNLKRSGKE